jgi:hypothetical protein
MKKYLMTGIAAVAMCAAFTSCSHDIASTTQEDIEMQRAEKIQNTYNKAFIATFGQPAADQDWGFSSSASARALTRSVDYTLKPVTPKYGEPEAPSFTTKTYINGLKPVFPEGYLTTKNAVIAQNSGVSAANSVDGNADWTDKVVYVSTGNTWVKDAQKLTIYVVDNMTNGWGTQDGSVIVVTEGVTLKLTSISNGTKVILAKDAILDLTELPSWAYEGYVHSITFNGSNSGLYMSSGSQLKAINVMFFNGCKVINNGGSITATKVQVDKNSILWNDGPTFKATTIHMENEDATVYNEKGRTINATNITTGNNYGRFYNEGTVKATGKVDLHNTEAEFVNAGTLEAGELDMRAGGKFYNASLCKTTIHGETYIQNKSAQWLNQGEYNSGDFTIYNAGRLFNDCKLTVHADAQGTTGTFKMDGTTHNSFVVEANSSVKTDYFILTAEGDFFMKDYSLLWIVNKLTSSNLNPDTGFKGVGTTAYSVIKAGEIAYTSAQRWRMNYFGKLFIDTDKHFPQAFDTSNNPADQPHYYFDSSVKLKFAPHNDACPLTSTIESGDCHHGYTVTPPPTDFTANLRVMAEDLSAIEQTDFDFNDIVFDIQYGSPAKIRVMAAGGTLPLRIKVKSSASHSDDACTGKDGNGWQEIHALWGKGTGIMINTNATKNVSPSKGYETTTLLDPIELDYEVTNAADANNIIIEVKKTVDGAAAWYPMNAAVGEPAAKFACRPGLRWAEEREDLKGHSNFKDWVQRAIGEWNWNNFQ